MLAPADVSKFDGLNGKPCPSLRADDGFVIETFSSPNRTHRDRKATYLKALESEIAKLRARESAHEAEIQACKGAVHRLKELIQNHNIPLPLDLASDPYIQGPQVTVELLGHPDLSQTFQTQFPAEYPYMGSSSHISSSSPLPSRPGVSSRQFFPGMEIGAATSSDPTPASGVSLDNISEPMPHPEGLGSTQVGIDFVLALEYICLEHHALHSANSEGSGHEMMLSSPIMFRSPPLLQTTQPGSGLPDGTRWTVPAVELEKLLDFSGRLDLDGEITPVEAWRRIRLHAGFAALTRDGLETLRVTLLPEVKCYG